MTGDITRNHWENVYRHGVKVGARERKRDPDNRRKEHPKRKEYDTKPEREAFDAGFKYGRDNAVPGVNLDIEGKANSTYDRSKYSQGLGEWVDD